MLRKFILVILISLIPSLLYSQTVGTPLSKLAFDQIAPDVKTATAYVHRIYIDGAATGTVVTTACTGSNSPFVCSLALPALTPGSHSIQLTAANEAGESAKSAPITFTYVVVPAAPQNLRIQ